MKTRPQVLFVVFLATFAVVHSGVVPTSVATAQDEDPTVVNSCRILTESGSYVVGEDFNSTTAGTCIDVRADDVVLDGADHVLDGLRPAEQFGLSSGIEVNDAANVTIRNVRLVDWDHGVSVNNSSAIDVSGLVVDGSGFGVTSENSTAVSVSELLVRDSGGAVSFDRVRESEVTDVFARNNSIAGFRLDQTERVTVTNATAIANESFGPRFARRADVVLGVQLRNSSNATFSELNVTENGGGLALRNTTDSNVSDCSVTDNRFGIRITDSEDDNIDACTVTENDVGLAIIESLRINVTGSEFESNELGIDLYDSENVTVEESTIVDTERVGLVLERADYNDFRGVTIEGTTADDALDGVSAGIFLDNATKNDFSELEVSDNENWAVFAIRDGTNDFDNSVFGTTQFSFRIRNVAFDAGGAESAEEDDPVEEFVPLDVAATQADSILNVTLREPVGEANETTAPGETETGDGEEETSDGETSDEETSDGDDETTAEDDSADEDEDTADAETEAEEETETEAALSIEMETPIAPVAKTAATTATEIPTIRG